MYNKALDTFKIVADCGSLTKAAEKLFISHTAVIKQINALESALGTTLLRRTHRGIVLTPAGECLYKEMPKLLRAADNLTRKVQSAGAAGVKVLRVGTSAMYPCQAFIGLWTEISQRCPQFRLQIVPIESDQRRTDLLGSAYDFLIGPYDPGFARNHTFFPVGEYRFTIALPRTHPLAGKERISFGDLEGGPLLLMRPGHSEVNDRIRHDIRKKHPNLMIQDIEPSYGLETFNLCMETGAPLLSLECWKGVHPGLCDLPLEEEYALPYGVLAEGKPSQEVREFLDLLSQSLQ